MVDTEMADVEMPPPKRPASTEPTTTTAISKKRKTDTLITDGNMMKAAIYYARRDIRVVNVFKPRLNEYRDRALIAVAWCDICGSDLEEYERGPCRIPTPEYPHPLTKGRLPITMGHEISGKVAHAPLGSDLKVGQNVVVDPRIYCNKCAECRAGATNGCAELGSIGFSGTGGGFSELVAVDPKFCYPLPDHVKLSHATLIEPLAVAWHAVVISAVSDWSKKAVLIVGGGPIGMACAEVLRVHGCKDIWLSEPSTVRRNRSELRGFDPSRHDVGGSLRASNGWKGVEVVFDCAGAQQGFDVGVDALEYRGLYINVASWTSPMVMPFKDYFLKEITLKASFAYTDKDFKDTVDAFMSGKFRGIERMIIRRIYIDEIVLRGFRELVQSKDEHIKILVTPRCFKPRSRT